MKTDTPFHRNLILENFTAFETAEFGFVPGVNAIIGENGTGKTHVLKALYAAQLIWMRNGGADRLQGVFQVEESVADLVRFGPPVSKGTSVSGEFGGIPWSFGIQRRLNHNGGGFGDGTGSGQGSGSGGGFGDGSGYGGPSPEEPTFVVGASPPKSVKTPVFIPAVDMMGHTKGFVSTFDNFKIDFDLTHREIVSLLLSPERRELTKQSQDLVANLAKCLGGDVELKGERFYLRSGDRRIAMPSVAEGLRKIATLIRLVQTGSLTEGSVFFWDEPEVNLNPILMDEVVGAILALSRSGIQVFIATHSYVILKELEVQATAADSLRYFALEATPSGSRVHRASKYLDLSPNKIEQQYGELYDRGKDKSMGESFESRMDREQA